MKSGIRSLRRPTLLAVALAAINPLPAPAQQEGAAPATDSAAPAEAPLLPQTQAASFLESPHGLTEADVSLFLSSRIDYVGTLGQRVRLPGNVWLTLRTQIPVLSASGRGELIVQDVDYRIEGAMSRRAAGVDWTPFAAVRGSENVDRPGSRGVLVAGLRAGRRDAEHRLDWRLEAAAAATDWGLEARALAGAAAEWRVMRRPGWEAGLLGEWEGVWMEGAGSPRTDLSAGGFFRPRRPSVLLPTLHARYYRGRSPLGLEETGVLIGASLSSVETGGGSQANRQLSGALLAGGGDDRVRARQVVEYSSASLARDGRPWRLRLLADNTLVDARAADLYYILEGGIETEVGTLRLGAHFHHRSGHLLGESNEQRLTLNVVELGARSPGWSRDLPSWSPQAGWRRLTYELRVGGVVTSEFGDRQRWIVRGGAVWTLPGRYRRLAPYAGLRGQLGEVREWALSGGAHTPEGFSVAVLAERDGQRIDRRDTSWTLLLGQRF